MTSRRRYEAPPLWSSTQIGQDFERAMEAFVEQRLKEGGVPYREAFTLRLRTLERLFEATGDLLTLSSVAGKTEFEGALRYLAGPPVSADDLKTLGRARRLANEPPAERAARIVTDLLDPLRFPWVGRGTAPAAQEREHALNWTASLWAVETVRTGRRVLESRDQEQRVTEVVKRAGFIRQKTPRRVDRPEVIARKVSTILRQGS